MNQPSPAPEIGPVIRQTRTARGMTLDQLAAASNVSKSMLSQIERGQANPTFAVLWGITRALGLEMSDLANPAAETAVMGKVDVVRHVGVPATTSRDGRCTLRILSPPHMVGEVEWYDMSFAPGGMLDSPPHARGAFEHLSVLDGVLEVSSGGDTQRLSAGEVARYAADVPHRIANASPAAARALLVLIYA
jgi:XRE family transcriptional regulator, regulator of sulfur utilization